MNEKALDELKPCPFCGSLPVLETSDRYPRYGGIADEIV